MRIYWVLKYDTYYPTSDNFEASFETLKEAEEYIESRQKEDEDNYEGYNYRLINIASRL